MTEAAPKAKRMRKPRLCDACQVAEWPSHGVGCPGLTANQPVEVRSVYLWHCGAPACAADLRARYAAKLREIGRPDLAARVLGETFRAVAADPIPAPVSAPSPGAALVARRSHKSRPPVDPAQGGLFGV